MKRKNEPGYILNFSDDILEKLEERLILLKDINTVLKHAEETGEYFINSENGHLLGYKWCQNITWWVEYVKDEKGYTIFNAYSRMNAMKQDENKKDLSCMDKSL